MIIYYTELNWFRLVIPIHLFSYMFFFGSTARSFIELPVYNNVYLLAYSFSVSAILSCSRFVPSSFGLRSFFKLKDHTLNCVFGCHKEVSLSLSLSYSPSVGRSATSMRECVSFNPKFALLTPLLFLVCMTYAVDLSLILDVNARKQFFFLDL